MSKAKTGLEAAKAARETYDRWWDKHQAIKQAMLFDTSWDEKKQVWRAAAIAFYPLTIEARTLEELIEKMGEVVPEYRDRTDGHEVERPVCVKLIFTLGPRR